MSALYRTATIRAVEQRWISRLGGGVLMDRAASAVAEAAARIARTLPRATPIVALVGPGNNGGDALLAASKLRDRGFPVRALALSCDEPGAEDARAVWRSWQAAGGSTGSLDELPALLEHAPLLLDGLFGIGLARPLDGAAALAVDRLEAARHGGVVAIDVPSGIDADTGAIVGGPDSPAIRATLTVTMIGDKPGLHTGAALDRVGAVVVAGLGLPGETAPDGELFDRALARGLLGPRARDTHKGSFGSVLVVGGATGTVGAALLAARGAQAAGAGKVFIAAPDAPVFDPGQPQLMTRPFDAGFDGIDAICIGCGLGRSAKAGDALERALRSALPLVLDADALNMLADDPALARLLAARDAPSVLTPHPLEAARLLQTASRAIQSDRTARAIELAARTGAVSLLKGAGSVVGLPGGGFSILAAGCAALATAGTGDVLAGVIAALLAQRLSAPDAARMGAWVHGTAGEIWQREHPSGAGLSAARLPELVTAAMQQP
ncbi:MAG TPA: NAD(P)H-hydrate dehydratase [Quisquiliibacterium sp.]|nr:NAD(P)H-hydrate dehydratase [Quisquiliibacterium sp.]